jgi:hypothetical protein
LIFGIGIHVVMHITFPELSKQTFNGYMYIEVSDLGIVVHVYFHMFRSDYRILSDVYITLYNL